MINVTKTYLPPLREFTELLEGIWENNWVTNNGPMVRKLEARLKVYLGVKHLFLVNNCTTALQIAVKALDIKKEIITTPFSYVATTSGLVWLGYKPVFADIETHTLTIDPRCIEKSITGDTEAIVATHIYGNPCDVGAIGYLARKHGLKVIYDAAHAFGVQYNNQSVLNYGDVSVLSFHATKLFHCFEGGALVTNNDEVAHRVDYMRNFGNNADFEQIEELGINAKMSEVHAINGLCMMPYIDDIIGSRKKITEFYDQLLFHHARTGLKKPGTRLGTSRNFSYYPVIFPDESSMLRVRYALEQENFCSRRYFYPSLNKLNYVAYQAMPVSESVAERILCLPLYPYLDLNQVYKIASIIRDNMHKREQQAPGAEKIHVLNEPI